MNQVFHRSWRGCLWGAKCGSRFCRLVLIMLAMLQASIALLVVLGKELPVPAPAGAWFINRLLDENWSAEWRELQIDLLGGVRAKNLRIYDSVTGTWILDIERLWLDLDFWEILTGKGPGLDRLYLSQGRLNAPGMYTRSGIDEQLLEHIATEIEMGSNWIQFNHLQFRIGGHSVMLSSPDRLPVDWTGETQATDLAGQLRRLVVRIQRAADKAPSMSPARLIGNIRPDENNGWHLDATVAVDRLELPKGLGTAHRSELILESILWQEDTTLGALRMRADTVQVEIDSQPAELNYLNLHIPAFEFSSADKWKLENLHFELHQLQTSWANLSQLGGEFSLDSSKMRPYGELRSYYENSPLHIDLRGLHGDLSGTLEVTGELKDLPSILNHFLEPEWLEFVPVTTYPIRFEASLDLEPGGMPSQARWKASLHSLDYRETHFPFVRAEGTSDFSKTDIQQADVWISPREQVRLRYRQLYPEPGFLLTAIGHSQQPLLNPILDFDWWWDIWEFVTPGNKPVFADVRVEGVWGQRNAVESWVGIEADEGSFRQLPLERLDLSIAQRPGRVDLYRLNGETNGGSFAGSLHWLQPEPERGQPTDQFFRVAGTMPMAELRQIAGEGFEWMDEIISEAAPEIDFYLERRQATEGPEHHKATVRIDHPAPVNAFGLPLSKLRTLAVQSPGKILLAPTQLNFLKGNVWLELEIEDLGETHPRFETRIRGRGIEHETMLNHFRTQFLGWNEADLPQLEGRPGKHDTDLKLRGYFGDTVTYVGQGRNRISEAELGQVRLFGELSRALEAVGLPFTSLQLETAEASWKLEDGKLHLPGVRIDGPSIRLNAHGTVAVPETDLDFVVQAFVIRGLFGLVFRPMNLVLEFRLGGQLDTPSWGLRINPFRWLGTGNSQ